MTSMPGSRNLLLVMLLSWLLACGNDEPPVAPPPLAGPAPVEVMVSSCLELVREQRHDDAISACLQAL